MKDHKFSNAPKGYDLMAEKDPWWRCHNFPLVPMFETKAADEYNTRNFTFSWLWFRAWSLDHLALEFAIELESTGLNIKIILPYLRIVIRVIPLPWDIMYKLRRKSKGDY